MHYYKFNVSSWAKDTSHLSLKEEAIYLRLINYYYDCEKPITLKTQMVLRKLRMADESETVELILEEFFTKTKNGWTHHHCDRLIAEYQKKAETNRKNGKSGGRPKINDLEKADGLPVDTETEPSGNLNHKLQTKEPLTNNDNNTITPDGDVTPPPEKPKKPTIDYSVLQMTDEQVEEVKRIRKQTKGVNSQRAINQLAKECDLSRRRGFSNDDILNEWTTRGWRSYKDEWNRSKPSVKVKATPSQPTKNTSLDDEIRELMESGL